MGDCGCALGVSLALRGFPVVVSGVLVVPFSTESPFVEFSQPGDASGESGTGGKGCTVDPSIDSLTFSDFHANRPMPPAIHKMPNGNATG